MAEPLKTAAPDSDHAEENAAPGYTPHIDEVRAVVTDILGRSLPSLVAVYLFGSHATGYANQASDIEFLFDTRVQPETRYLLQEQLAQALHTDVDLMDLMGASTVVRAQVLKTALVLLDGNRRARQAFEVFALSSYALLNEERSSILNDIYERGHVYG